MLIQKKLLEQLIELASDSAEYLNEKWITVKPHGADSKGTHVLVKDGETSKEAVERKFGGSEDKKEDTFIGKKFIDRNGKEKEVLEYLDKHKMYTVSTGLSGIKDLMSKEELEQELFVKYNYYVNIEYAMGDQPTWVLDKDNLIKLFKDDNFDTINHIVSKKVVKVEKIYKVLGSIKEIKTNLQIQ